MVIKTYSSFTVLVCDAIIMRDLCSIQLSFSTWRATFNPQSATGSDTNDWFQRSSLGFTKLMHILLVLGMSTSWLLVLSLNVANHDVFLLLRSLRVIWVHPCVSRNGEMIQSPKTLRKFVGRETIQFRTDALEVVPRDICMSMCIHAHKSVWQNVTLSHVIVVSFPHRINLLCLRNILLFLDISVHFDMCVYTHAHHMYRHAYVHTYIYTFIFLHICGSKLIAHLNLHDPHLHNWKYICTGIPVSYPEI